MPAYAPRRCPTCKTRVMHKGPCPVCAKNRYTASGYVYKTKAWRRLRDQVLSEEPVCRVCRAPAPSDVDHIRPIASRPDLAFSRENLQALCHACHSRKTSTEK